MYRGFVTFGVIGSVSTGRVSIHEIILLQMINQNSLKIRGFIKTEEPRHQPTKEYELHTMKA